MAKATVYSIVLAPELRDAFLAAAAASERPPAQVLRGLMREFIQRQQEAEAGEASSEGTAESADDNVTAVTAPPEMADTAAAADAPAAQEAAAPAPAPTAEASSNTDGSNEAKEATSPAAA